MGLVLATEETGGGGTFCRGSWQSLTEDPRERTPTGHDFFLPTLDLLKKDDLGIHTPSFDDEDTLFEGPSAEIRR